MSVSPNNLYNILINHFGNQDWWPFDKSYHITHGSDYRFEIMLGAILTQNTAWSNVEKALMNIKNNNSLNIKKIIDTPIKKLRSMIQPSGYFNQKSMRVKNLAEYIFKNYNDNLDNFFNRDLKQLRDELLSLIGIGPETADSILLYAGNFPIFVVDAYTKRICKRIPIMIKNDSYDDIQRFFEDDLLNNLSEDDIVSRYKELHALIVELAKNYCKTNPRCSSCPLKSNCRFEKNQTNR